MASLFKSSSTTVSSINEGIENVYKMINDNLSGSKPLTGTPTGFEKIDAKSGGLQKSDLIIVAGETSQGKTSLAVSMMRNASLSGARIAMYSMEMKKSKLRLVFSLWKVEYQPIKSCIRGSPIHRYKPLTRGLEISRGKAYI